MIEKLGIKGTENNGIFFSESAPSNYQILGTIKTEISRQNSNLSEVKKEMAKKAKRIGANSIINFKYGQKSHKWWQLVFTFKWDTESWFGVGDAVNL